MDVARIFAHRPITPCFSQSRIGLPIFSWDNNQPCNRDEDFAKQYEASNKNGVVGKTGRKIPTIPKTKKRIPAKL